MELNGELSQQAGWLRDYIRAFLLSVGAQAQAEGAEASKKLSTACWTIALDAVSVM